MRLYVAFLALVIALPVAGGTYDSRLVEHATVVGARGTLVLRIPREWSVQVHKLGNGQPPTIQLTGDAGGPFRVDIAPSWPRQHSPLDFGSAAHLRASVEQQASAPSGAKMENAVPVQELGGGNPGYFFEYTNPAPAPGDPGVFLFGVARVGTLVCTFQLQSKPDQAAVRAAVLEAMRTALHQPYR